MKTFQVIAIVSLLLFVIYDSATAQTYQHAVKVVCGKAGMGDVAKGTYFTAINVHNPNDTVVTFKWKVARSDENVAPSRFTTETLGPDGATEITCARAAKYGGISQPGYFAGFVVIESHLQLDVVAVYSAAGSTALVEAIHMERVPARRIK